MTDARLMLITDEQPDLEARVFSAVSGGIGIVQVRERQLDDHALHDLVWRLLRGIEGRAEVIVNGRPHVAEACGVGLHLPYRDAETFTGHARSVSIHSQEEAQAIEPKNIDYVLIGTLFPTSCKPDVVPLGIERTSSFLTHLQNPGYAIGGILPSHVQQLLDAGFYGVAVRSGILSDPNPDEAAARYQGAFGKTKERPNTRFSWATLPDAQRIIALVNAAYGRELRWKTQHRVTLAEMQSILLSPDQRVLMLLEGNILVGCVLLDNRTNIPWFGMLSIWPGMHGLGLGRVLLQELERICRDEYAVSCIACDVGDFNPHLLKYYGAQGYAVVGERPWIGPELKTGIAKFIRMEKILL